MNEPKDFISLYLDYTCETECPTFFHRWAAVSCLGAWLGRDFFFNHGHFTLHPNLYVMLIGAPGTKKSSAIKIGAKLLTEAGYTTFAAKKTRQEKFLLDLAEQSGQLAEGSVLDELDMLDRNLWGAGSNDAASYSTMKPAECFVAADEFNNFIGLGNIDFVSILGELWDYEGVYDYKLKSSKSVYIPNPTISILGGNTPTGFSQAFPPEAIGQGFFSRLLLVYGEPSGVKYTFPPAPDLAKRAALIDMLTKIKTKVVGEASISQDALVMVDRIYHTWEGIDDARFEHYTNRRLTHLLKLCLVIAASKMSTVITKEVVLEGNTLLSFTESLMPRALGEFGKAKHSEVVHKVKSIIDNASAPVKLQALWKDVYMDLDKMQQLIEILSNLQQAEKIQAVGKGEGFLPVRKALGDSNEGLVNWNLLTPNEVGLI